MIKVGVIGAGSMGKNHIRNYLELNNLFEFVGFYDASEENAKKTEELFNIKSFKTIEELLDNVDAVSVVVPSSLHKEIGLIVASKKVHALIEKPLALNKEDCEILSKAFKENNLVLTVGHIERFSPPMIELFERIKDEKIIAVEAKRCGPYDSRISDTNVIMDLMIHDIDLICSKINKSKIKEIKSIGVHAFSNNRIDYISAVCGHENGVVSNLIASRVTQIKIRTIKIHTTTSYYIVDLLNKTLEVHKNSIIKSAGDKVTIQNECEKVSLSTHEPLRFELMEFASSIKDGQPRVSSEDATYAVELANLIEEDAKNYLSVEA